MLKCFRLAAQMVRVFKSGQKFMLAADSNQCIQASHDLNAETEGFFFKSLLLITQKMENHQKILS
jgi:hypothetical protein